jgi:anti-sigma B factor antagonist
MQQSAFAPEFFCVVRPDHELVIVRVVGELDFGVAPEVAATVDELLGVGFERIVVDLRELTFLDSAGVHAFVAMQHAAARRGCALSFVRGPRNVDRVFELTATNSVLTFDDARGVA